MFDASPSLDSQRRQRSIERRFQAAFRSCDAVSPGSLLLVGVSGGPDSTALLLLLVASQESFGFSCEIAYFDHQIRSADERATELEVVRALAEKLGLTLHLASAAVPARAREQKRSIEEQARVDRYHFLADTARLTGATIVAVGHTADDQAETILLHLLRGSGLRGIAGMQSQQGWPVGPGPALIRPLLQLGRSDTQAYCLLRGAATHSDSQNLSPQATRNRIRSELLPLLRSFNPRISDALVRLGLIATEQVALLESLAAIQAKDEAATGRLSESLPIDLLRNAGSAVRAELLGAAFARVSGGREGLTERHLAALRAMIHSSGSHGLDLSRGIRARVTAGSLLFETRFPTGTDNPPAPMPEHLAVPGSVRFGGWQIVAEVVDSGLLRDPGPRRAVLSLVGHAPSLTVRARRLGDRMRPSGMTGSKKVQDILVNAKVPRAERDFVPIVCAGDEIVWIAGVRAAAIAQVRDRSKPRIVLTAKRLDELE